MSDIENSGPVYGFYGDDFTGATDTLAHLARAGLRTLLFLSPPDATRLAALDKLDAIGVAGAARSMRADEQQQELARAGAALAALGVRVLHYKVCSTFDSAPDVGSIGVAVRTLREYCANPLVAIVGGQPDLRRYCVFGELFAAAGADDQHQAIYRIDRHPTMSRHPVTPMNEADLRRHLQRQGLERVQSIDWRCYAAGADVLHDEIQQRLEDDADAVLFDVFDQRHLKTIGRELTERAAAAAPLLAVGPSSVAQAFTSAMSVSEGWQLQNSPVPRLAQARGPVFALAGSLSPLTAVQIEAAHSYLRIELDPLQMTGRDSSEYVASRVKAIASHLRGGRNVLAYTARQSSRNEARDTALPPLAHACATLLQQVLNAVRLKRVGIAGGDTSSIAVRALGAWGLSYLAPLSAGVTVCTLHADNAALDGMEIMLKGGQMGDADLFEQLIDGLPCEENAAV